MPTLGGHGESVNIETEKKVDVKNVVSLLEKQKGVVVNKKNNYTTPIESQGKDDVFVSRIRKDASTRNGINMWIVADPLRKGAATNAVQILKHMISINK